MLAICFVYFLNIKNVGAVFETLLGAKRLVTIYYVNMHIK